MPNTLKLQGNLKVQGGMYMTNILPAKLTWTGLGANDNWSTTTNWAVQTSLPDTGNYDWLSVTFGNGRFVAIGYAGNVAYSNDGKKWVLTSNLSGGNWRSVTFGNGRFVAVSADTTTAYSDDGITWIQTNNLPYDNWSSVTFGNGRFVTVAYDSYRAAYSNDGITWTERSLPDRRWRSVTFGNGRFVAVAESTSTTAYSDDGITWTQGGNLPASAMWCSITFGNGRFVAVAEDGRSARSSNIGLSWQTNIGFGGYNWISVTFGNGRFVAVTYNDNILAYSDTGISWSRSTLPTNTSWYSVTFGNGRFVAVANDGNVVYSDDGIIWNRRSAPINFDTLIFTGTNRLSPVNDLTPSTRFNGITFDSAGAGAFILSGNSFQIDNGDITSYSIAYPTVINNDIILGSNIGSINCVYSSSDIIINGNISGPGPLIKAENATLSLSGNNTYTGFTAISGGTLIIYTLPYNPSNKVNFASFTNTALTVDFATPPSDGDSFILLPGTTLNSYSSVILQGAGSSTATYNSINSTLLIDVPPDSLVNGLLAYYKLDDNGSGGLSLIDSSNNGYTLTNISNVTLGTGKINGDAVFSGTNYLSGNIPSIGSSPFSYSFWHKETNGQYGLFGPNQWGGLGTTGGGTYSWGIYRDSNYGEINLLWSQNGTALNNRMQTGASFADGTWHHYVIVYDGTDAILYVDGTNVYQAAVGFTPYSGAAIPLNIGATNGQSEAEEIDEVGIWTRALTPTEITRLYNSGNGNTYPFNSLLNGIQAYWNMNESSGSRIDSVSGLQITEVGGTIPSTPGINGNAAAITDGDSAWLALPAGICDIGTGAKSFSIWFKLAQSEIGYQLIWMQGYPQDAVNTNIVYIENDGTLNSLFMTSTENHWSINLGGNIIPEPGVWHHFVGTYSGSQYTAYYNGNQIGQFNYTGSISTDNTQYTLGHYNAFPNGIGGSLPFNGAIDNVGIWDRVLTQAEISTLYNSGNGKSYPFL